MSKMKFSREKLIQHGLRPRRSSWKSAAGGTKTRMTYATGSGEINDELGSAEFFAQADDNFGKAHALDRLIRTGLKAIETAGIHLPIRFPLHGKKVFKKSRVDWGLLSATAVWPVRGR